MDVVAKWIERQTLDPGIVGSIPRLSGYTVVPLGKALTTDCYQIARGRESIGARMCCTRKFVQGWMEFSQLGVECDYCKPVYNIA